jgi:bifunctional non-homologous end joining protein LigD
VRAVVYVEDGDVRVLTRNDREVSATYPELRGLAKALGHGPYVLDGEVVAFDEAGRPSFGELQQRMHVRAPSAALLERVPVSFLAFDLLYAGGRSLLKEPYDKRRALLEQLDLSESCAAVPPAFEGDGAAALAASESSGLEGVVAKKRDSAYDPGRRSTCWLKLKHIRMQEVVVGGWRPGEGRREKVFGSLLLGVHDDAGRLVYAGHVGTGFSDRVLDDLTRQLAQLATRTPPFADEVPRAHAKDARWVRPELVGEVAFTEWTKDGRMRHPAWRGLRSDKSPADVVRES